MFKFIKIKNKIQTQTKTKQVKNLIFLKKKTVKKFHESKFGKTVIIKKLLHREIDFIIKNIQKYYGKSWLKKLKIFNLILARTKPVRRFKMFYINFAIYLYFFENTIPLKDIFFRAIKYRPIRKHKRYTKNILIVIQNCVSILQSQNISTKLQIIFKGKLGLRGDNKKKKNIYVFSTRIKYTLNKVHYYDGIGSSSGYGHTFMRLRYGPTIV